MIKQPSAAQSQQMLVQLNPIVETSLERHLETAKEWFPHEYVPYQLGRNFTAEPWQESDSRLSEIARAAIELNLLTEDNLPYYHLALWGFFGAEGAWGAWVRRWTAEEGRHSIAIRDYLVTTRGIDPAVLERGRMEHVSRGYYPRKLRGPLDGLVYVTLQELATRISHRNTGAIADDPIAEKLFTRISLDENLHYLFYREVAAAAIEIDPSAMVEAIKRQVIGFTMPGLELPGFRDTAVRVAAAGIYDLRIHHDQVLSPVVLTHWNLTGLTHLSDAAEVARDEILEFLQQLDGTAARMRGRSAAA
jgi:acyl-[acyl-carrier-protein] desaturase